MGGPGGVHQRPDALAREVAALDLAQLALETAGDRRALGHEPREARLLAPQGIEGGDGTRGIHGEGDCWCLRLRHTVSLPLARARATSTKSPAARPIADQSRSAVQPQARVCRR